MSENADPITLVEFIEAARDRGAADTTIRQLLLGRGWPKQFVEAALLLADERRIGLPIPTPADRGGGSARDLFLYLLSFISLSIWSQALGQIAFIAIDRMFDDPLARSGNFSYSLASSLARLVVLFPVYILLMRLLLADLATNPNKYQSGLRKWLTYLALFIAALIAIGDLILFFTEFLRGALTFVFTLKSLVVLAIAGGILWYYFSWLQRQPRER